MPQQNQYDNFPQEPNESQSWDQPEGDGPITLPGGSMYESSDHPGWTINVGENANVTVGRVVHGDQRIDGGLVIGSPFSASEGAEEADYNDSVAKWEMTPIDRVSEVVAASGGTALQGAGVEFSAKGNDAESERTSSTNDESKPGSAHDTYASTSAKPKVTDFGGDSVSSLAVDSGGDKPGMTVRRGGSPLAQDVVSRAYDVFQKRRKSRF